MDQQNLNSIRSEILAAILKKTQGAYFIPAADAAGMIDGRCCYTTYRQIDSGRFPLPVVRLGRNWAVRVHDLADFLSTGQFQREGKPALPVKRGPGRPRKGGAV